MEQDEKYRLLIENINDGVVISQNDKFIFFNKQFAKMLGYEVDELLMKDYRGVYTARGLQILRERTKHRKLGERVPAQYETAFKRKDGTEIDIEANVTIVDYKGDKATFAIIRDITERKKAEEEIQAQKQYFEALFNSSPSGLVSLDMKEKIVQVNPQFEKIFGFKSEDIVGRNIDDIIVSKKLHKDAVDLTKLVYRNGVAIKEAKRMRKDGTLIDVSIGAAPIFVGGKQTGALGIYTDISDRKKAEAEIQTQRQYFEALFNSSPGGIVSLDMDEKIVNCNPQFEKLFGYSREEIIGKMIDDIIVPENLLQDAREITKLVQQGGIAVKEAKRKRKDGGLIDVSIGGAPIIVDEKQVGILAIYLDITSIKKAEQQIRTQKQYFEALFNSAVDGIISLDLEDCIVDVNPQFEKLFGYKISEIKGRNIDDVIVRKGDFKEANEVTHLIQRGGIAVSEGKRLRKDGSLIDVSIGGAPIVVGGKQIGVLAVYRDITDRKKAEGERERIIQDLQDALNRVKTLSGLIPICANCKKIRDDQGYWSDVELYISKHSEAEFSHGLCSECMEKLYPEQYARLKAKGKLTGS